MKFELDKYNRNVPDEKLIADLQGVASRLDKPNVTRAEHDELGKFRSKIFINRFGSWFAAHQRAGLEARTSKPIPVEELFRNLEEVWISLGRQPLYGELTKPLSNFGITAYGRRFGGWHRALEAFVEYINGEESTSTDKSIRNRDINPSTKHKTSRTINWRLRFIVMRRDNFKCKSCGRSPATEPTIVLHVDHITAWTKGGETVLENLQTLCSKCNIGKSDLEFLNSSQTEVQNVEI